MRLRVIIFARSLPQRSLWGWSLPSAGAKPKPVKPGQFVTYTCATGETAGSGTVAWFDKNGKVISVSTATASGATLRAGPAPAQAKSYEWRSVICIPPATTTTVAATTTSSSTTTTIGAMTRPGRYPQELRSGPSGWCSSTRTSISAVGRDLLHRPQVRDVVGDAAQVGPPRRDRRRPPPRADQRRAPAAEDAGAGEPRAAAGQRDPEVRGGFLWGGARPPVDE